MRKRLAILFVLFLVISTIAVSQNSNSNTNTAKTTTAKKKSGPVFRATKDQIMEAQKILKDRGLYTGEQTGKLDDATKSKHTRLVQLSGL
jgi:hypothetical protein